MVEYYPISAKDLSRIHQFGKKVLQGIFLGYALCARNLGRRHIDLEELENIGAPEIYARRRDAKEVITPKSGEKSYVQSQMEK